MTAKGSIMWVMLLAVLLLPVKAAVGQDAVSSAQWTQIIEQIGTHGNINWSAGYIEAVGIGTPPERFIGRPQARPMALRAAQIDAYRNLLETTKGVRVDSATTVSDFTVVSDVINTQVDGIVKNANVVKQEYLSDGTVEVIVRMSLTGHLAPIIMPRALDKKLASPPPAVAPPTPPPATPPATPPAAAPPKPPAAGVVYTGLVVDARGIQVRPAMSPRILDESGREVYGTMQVEREFAVQQGMTGYARDLTAAMTNPRVTNNPLTIKGIKAEGAGKADIVISNSDADAIRTVTENLAFLKKCRVMVVLD